MRRVLMDPIRQITLNFTEVFIRFKEASTRVLKWVCMEFKLTSVLWHGLIYWCLSTDNLACVGYRTRLVFMPLRWNNRCCANRVQIMVFKKLNVMNVRNVPIGNLFVIGYNTDYDTTLTSTQARPDGHARNILFMNSCRANHVLYLQ